MSVTAFLSSLVLAAISGITYIAYKHAKQFKTNIAPPMFGFVCMSVLAILIYTAGSMSFSINAIVEEVSVLEIENVTLKTQATSLQEMFDLQCWSVMVGSVIFLYLVMLVNLQNILGLEQDQEMKGK